MREVSRQPGLRRRPSVQLRIDPADSGVLVRETNECPNNIFMFGLKVHVAHVATRLRDPGGDAHRCSRLRVI